MQNQPTAIALIELVRLSARPMALYDEAGALIAASPQAEEGARRAGCSLATIEDVGNCAAIRFTVSKLESCGYSVAVEESAPEPSETEVLVTSILDACPAAIVVLNPKREVQRWNRAAEQLYGYTFEEVRGKVLPVVTPEEQATFEHHVQMLLSGQSITSVPVLRRRKDGALREILLSASPVLDREGKVIATVAAYEDVTELHAMVRNLEQARAHIFHAQRLAALGSWTLDFTDGALAWSPEVHRIHGTDPATFKPTRQSFRSLVHPDDLDALNAAVERTRATGAPYSIEHRLVRPDGEIRHCRISAEAVKDEAGKVVRLIGIVQDVTESKQLQEQLMQAQKLETVGRLAGGIAHDFNNLLTIINGHAELLLMRPEVAGSERDSIKAIHEAGQRAASLTRQLLTIGRKQRTEFRIIDLNQAFQEASHLIQRLAGDSVQLKVELSPDSLPVKADAPQIQQVLLNLSMNARDAMPEGGRITLSTRLVRGAPPAYVTGHYPKGADWAEFSVTDTGCGIDEAVRGRIFEPFVTTKSSRGHSGLGLSTAHGILREHCGDITFETSRGGGTTFRGALPLDVPAGGSEAAAQPAAPVFNNARMVVVEDQPAVRLLVCTVLASLGYEVEEFASPEAALARLEDPAGVDLLITDLVMPDMDGRDLASRARRFRPNLPVLYMSGYSEPAGDAAITRGPDVGFIAKPFHPKDLAAEISRLLSTGA